MYNQEHMKPRPEGVRDSYAIYRCSDEFVLGKQIKFIIRDATREEMQELCDELTRKAQSCGRICDHVYVQYEHVLSFDTINDLREVERRRAHNLREKEIQDIAGASFV